ncbi:MAG: M20/M25/M40 family metallo-hydrolase [Halobacteriales archaeon]|nr:M20/M25/M40 family metallo-hydrolase [Halobacteriales archaeon]
MNEVEELTRQLVRIPSYEDETQAGDFIEDWLREETGATVERDDAGNVLAYHGEPRTALVGHHDTVPPAEGQTRDGKPTVEERDGRLYGRGTADMKGAVASAMLAFRDASCEDTAFVSFVGEERGGIGAKHAIGEGFVPDRAVVIEGSAGYSSPDSFDVAVAHRGRRELRVVASGEARHAGETGDGSNAVYTAVDAVNRVRRHGSPTVEVEGGTLEGSLTVTRIEGAGEATNVVPSRCEFTVDERTVPGVSPYDFESDVESEVVDEMPPMECDDIGFARLVCDAAREDTASELVVKPHATDAGWLASAGSSCVVCGPAERGEAHTDDESVSLELLELTERVYRRLLERA